MNTHIHSMINTIRILNTHIYTFNEIRILNKPIYIQNIPSYKATCPELSCRCYYDLMAYSISIIEYFKVHNSILSHFIVLSLQIHHISSFIHFSCYFAFITFHCSYFTNPSYFLLLLTFHISFAFGTAG